MGNKSIVLSQYSGDPWGEGRGRWEREPERGFWGAGAHGSDPISGFMDWLTDGFVTEWTIGTWWKL